MKIDTQLLAEKKNPKLREERILRNKLIEQQKETHTKLSYHYNRLELAKQYGNDDTIEYQSNKIAYWEARIQEEINGMTIEEVKELLQ